MPALRPSYTYSKPCLMVIFSARSCSNPAISSRRSKSIFVLPVPVGRDGAHLWEAMNFVARRVGEKLGPDCLLASFSQATCGGYGVSETL